MSRGDQGRNKEVSWSYDERGWRSRRLHTNNEEKEARRTVISGLIAEGMPVLIMSSMTQGNDMMSWGQQWDGESRPMPGQESTAQHSTVQRRTVRKGGESGTCRLFFFWEAWLADSRQTPTAGHSTTTGARWVSHPRPVRYLYHCSFEQALFGADFGMADGMYPSLRRGDGHERKQLLTRRILDMETVSMPQTRGGT